jgi:hypothetical protein
VYETPLLFVLTNIIWLNKSKTMILAGLCLVWWKRNLKEENSLEDQGVDGCIILKFVCKK